MSYTNIGDAKLRDFTCHCLCPISTCNRWRKETIYEYVTVRCGRHCAQYSNKDMGCQHAVNAECSSNIARVSDNNKLGDLHNHEHSELKQGQGHWHTPWNARGVTSGPAAMTAGAAEAQRAPGVKPAPPVHATPLACAGPPAVCLSRVVSPRAGQSHACSG